MAPLKSFLELSDFQKWVFFYLKQKGIMKANLEDELINFCDTTKNLINLDNYEEDLKKLNSELAYLVHSNIVRLTNSEQNIELSPKGELYFFQHLQPMLDKLNEPSILRELKGSLAYRRVGKIGETILRNSKRIEDIARLVINDPKNTMALIHGLSAFLEWLQRSGL